jgi:rhamnulokinase
MTRDYLALDLGAESGRAIVGRFNGDRIALHEVHRFANVPITLNDGLHWDAAHIRRNLLAGINLATQFAPDIRSLSIDSWGVDYGLLDDLGQLLHDPFHYRDARIDCISDEAFERVSGEALFRSTGCQPLQFNTLFQLLDDARHGRLDRAATMILIPDLFAYWLTGNRGSEATIASTTQLFDPRTRTWCWELIDRFGLSKRLFTPVNEPGVIRGELVAGSESDRERRSSIAVISGTSHDTASAFAGSQATQDTLVISSGTWSLIGKETAKPLTTEAAFAAGFTNEAGIGGTNRFLRVACGLWLLQECKRHWAREGTDLTYQELADLAEATPPFGSIIDPEDFIFLPPGDMPARIASYCLQTGQPVPETRGAMVRTVLESLALSERLVLESMEEVTSARIDRIQIVGGGSRNALKCQLTADATGRDVLSGPSEATALGNAMVQALALGDVASLREIREIVQRSVPVVFYHPSSDARTRWDDAFNRFRQLRQSKI